MKRGPQLSPLVTFVTILTVGFALTLPVAAAPVVAAPVVAAPVVAEPAGATQSDVESGRSDPSLADAVAVLRGVDLESQSSEETALKSQKIDLAWRTLIDAGPAGRAALLAELGMLKSTGERDDYYEISAAALLWRIGGVDDADVIADIWRSVPFEADYSHVFCTAYDAAKSRDPRVLPMLVAFLGDKSGGMFVPEHSLDVEWPLSLDFVWGVYGRQGYPVLCEIAAEPGNPVMAESALAALRTSEYPDALPVARRLAAEGETAGIRRAAVRLLGWHGRAMDWEHLLIGLTSDDVDDILASLWALHKSGDERAVSYAIPFCDHPDPWVRDEALSLLALACTPESIEAMHRVCEEQPDDPRLDGFAFYAEAVLWAAGLDWEVYPSIPSAAREQAIAQVRAILYGPKPGAARLSHDEATAMARHWIDQGCIDCEGLDDLESQVAAALVRDDIPLLQELRASVYRHLSDEALCDVSRVERIIQNVVRRDLAGKGP